MKLSEFKNLIRQGIMEELNEDETIQTGDPDAALKDKYDFLAEDSTDKIEQAIKSKKIDAGVVKAAAEKALRGDATELAVLMATGQNFAKLEEAEEEVADEETIDITTPDSAEVEDVAAAEMSPEMDMAPSFGEEPTYTAEEAALMDDLDNSLKKAQDLGDEKLATLIGNIITYFTRQHVVKEGEAGRKKHYKGAVKDDEDQISKLEKDMKFDKKQLKTESLEILKMKKLAGLLTEGEYAKALLKENMSVNENRATLEQFRDYFKIMIKYQPDDVLALIMDLLANNGKNFDEWTRNIADDVLDTLNEN